MLLRARTVACLGGFLTVQQLSQSQDAVGGGLAVFKAFDPVPQLAFSNFSVRDRQTCLALQRMVSDFATVFFDGVAGAVQFATVEARNLGNFCELPRALFSSFLTAKMLLTGNLALTIGVVIPPNPSTVLSQIPVFQ